MKGWYGFSQPRDNEAVMKLEGKGIIPNVVVEFKQPNNASFDMIAQPLKNGKCNGSVCAMMIDAQGVASIDIFGATIGTTDLTVIVRELIPEGNVLGNIKYQATIPVEVRR